MMIQIIVFWVVTQCNNKQDTNVAMPDVATSSETFVSYHNPEDHDPNIRLT